MNNNEGLSGKIAALFLESKLTVLLMIVFLAIGAYSTFLIPREEEPQIQIPIADIYVSYPGANPKEVEKRIAQPLEKMISNIKGVEYVYSTSANGMAMIIVQFYVGEDIERSIVKLYDEINKNMDKMPSGVSMPLVKTRSIDDVPIMSLTLWSETRDDYMLKQIGQELGSEIKKINDISNINIIGGRDRQIRVELDKNKLAANHVDFLTISQSIQASNSQMQSGSFNSADNEVIIQSGNFLTSKEDVENLIIGSNGTNPVYLKQVATISDGPQVSMTYTSFGYGSAHKSLKNKFKSDYPSVTLTVSKKKGADAMKIAEKVREIVTMHKKDIITDDIHVTETRNYGESASEKVSELLMHLMMAIIAVTILVMFAMGWRGALVVFLSVPITFALTLFAYYFMDYTLNRITLFALVFVTGIVVDDSIIIAENMHRHFHMRKLPFKEAALYAINEVGNPTILATFTVIAAILPMAFVSGMMGPYMSPMPIGASIAMLLSLIIALTVTPYLGYRFLLTKEDWNQKSSDHHSTEENFQNNKIYKIYEKILLPMLNVSKKRRVFLGVTGLILLLSCSAFYFKWVAVKMLPFDNKNEFQVVIDMPEGTTLERTAALTKEVSLYLSEQKNVVSYQTYIGTSAPITFNGLVRHYDVRRGSNVADIQVNLTHKEDRKLQSHDLVKSMRADIQSIGRRYNGNIKLVEVPPGPPVLSTIVAEVYGPDYENANGYS